MRIISKLIISAVAMTCAVGGIFADVPQEKMKLSRAETKPWKSYEVETGIPEQPSVIAQFPTEPLESFMGFDANSKIYLANKDFATYTLTPMHNGLLFYKNKKLLPPTKNFNSYVEYQMGFLKAWIKERIDTGDENNTCLSHDIYLNNEGLPTLDMIEIVKGHKVRRSRTILTKYVAYIMATETEAGFDLYGQHDRFVNSFQIN